MGGGGAHWLGVSRDRGQPGWGGVGDHQPGAVRASPTQTEHKIEEEPVRQTGGPMNGSPCLTTANGL